jgi:hypothetical protein
MPLWLMERAAALAASWNNVPLISWWAAADPRPAASPHVVARIDERITLLVAAVQVWQTAKRSDATPPHHDGKRDRCLAGIDAVAGPCAGQKILV